MTVKEKFPYTVSMNQILAFGMPGAAELLIILIVVGLPLFATGVVVFVVLKLRNNSGKPPAPSELPEEKDSDDD